MKKNLIFTIVISLVIILTLVLGVVGYGLAKKAVYSDIENQLRDKAEDWKLIAESYEESMMDEEQAKEFVENLMAKQVIGESGYIWVTDSNGVYIVSKDRLRDGEDISESKDADGVLFIQEAIRKAKAAGSGTDIQKYPWQNQGDSKPRMKIAGLSYMEEWDWVIGPSAYYDDLDNGTLKIVRNSLLVIGIIIIVIVAIFAFAFVNYDKK
jgi:signal transduction histidine kinase